MPEFSFDLISAFASGEPVNRGNRNLINQSQCQIKNTPVPKSSAYDKEGQKRKILISINFRDSHNLHYGIYFYLMIGRTAHRSLRRRFLAHVFLFRLDAGTVFFDGRPLFGPSKTVRGILFSVLVTTASAPVIGLDLTIGAIVAVAAMAGDLFSSFVKRRLNTPPSSQALGLDRFPNHYFRCWHAATHFH